MEKVTWWKIPKKSPKFSGFHLKNNFHPRILVKNEWLLPLKRRFEEKASGFFQDEFDEDHLIAFHFQNSTQKQLIQTFPKTLIKQEIENQNTRDEENIKIENKLFNVYFIPPFIK